MRQTLLTFRQNWFCLFLSLALLAVAFPAAADKLNNTRSGEALERRSGGDAKHSNGPSAEDRRAEKAEIPPDDDTTIWLSRDGGKRHTRFSNNPNDQGWWVDKEGMSYATYWNEIKTSCTPCQGLVERYNDAMGDLYGTRREIHEAKEIRDHRLKELRQALDRGKASRERSDRDEGGRRPNLAADADPYVAYTAEINSQMEDVNEAYEAQVRHLRAEVARKEGIAKLLAHQIAECEKQCAGTEGTTGILIDGFGGWVPKNPPPGVQDPLALPFPWAGPYTTCFPCQKLADALNGLPQRAREELRSIKHLSESIREIDSGAAEKDDRAANGDAIDFWDETRKRTAEDFAREKANLEASIERHRENLAKITAYFNQVLGMLRECERTRCRGAGASASSASSSTGGVHGDGKISTELEYTVSITGSNPFDVREIERIPDMVNGTSASSASGGSSSSGSSAGGSSASSSSGASSSSSGGTTPPLQVNVSGSFSFSHTVGSSPCPQSAGTAIITSNNGNPLNITGISVSGTISSKLNVNPNGAPSAALQLQGQFNCSSPANGTFTGNVTGTVTDTVTGETAPISISATGSVSG